MGIQDVALVQSRILNPLYTFTIIGNKEVVVSDVDVTTNTFTSVAHGLNDGDELNVAINNDAGAIFLVDKIPGGLNSKSNTYFVANKTDDTFQLSLTSGGAIIDITENANLDLTKWHFERLPLNSKSKLISNLDLYKYRIVLSGKSLKTNTTQHVIPNNLQGNIYIRSANGQLGTPLFYTPSTIRFHVEIVVDYTEFAFINVRGFGVAHNNVSSNVVATANNYYFLPTVSNGQKIQSLYFNNWYFGNGSKIKIYRY